MWAFPVSHQLASQLFVQGLLTGYIAGDSVVANLFHKKDKKLIVTIIYIIFTHVKRKLLISCRLKMHKSSNNQSGYFVTAILPWRRHRGCRPQQHPSNHDQNDNPSNQNDYPSSQHSNHLIYQSNHHDYPSNDISYPSKPLLQWQPSKHHSN